MDLIGFSFISRSPYPEEPLTRYPYIYNPKEKMLNLKPGNITIFLLLLTLPVLPSYASPGDSLANKLSRTKKPDQQILLLHQLYNRSCFENTHEAEKYIMSAIDIGMRSGNTAGMMESYKKLAALYELQRNYMQAYLFYQEAQKSAVEADLTDELALLNYHTGVALCRLDRYAEAITYLQHAALSAAKTTDIPQRAAFFQSICLFEAEHEEKAQQQIDSLISSAKGPGQQSLLAFYCYELQQFWLQKKEYLKAIPLNEEAINIFHQTNDHHYTILALKARAEICLGTDSVSRATEFLRRALSVINNAGTFNYLKPAVLDGLSLCYKRANDLVLSQSYERQAKMLKDSMTVKGKSAMMPIQSVSYPGVLPYRKSSIGGFNSWQGRLAPLLLVGLGVLSGVIWFRYRKIKTNIEKEKDAALLVARQVAEQEKQIALREALDQLEKEKETVAHEARGLVEKVREEARNLQAQIATTSALLANKTEYLQQLQEKLGTTNNEDCKRLAREIRSNIGDNDYWGEFIRSFNLLHQNTVDKITQKHPDLTPNEVKLTCFILAGMNNKEIAGIFMVEPESVKKAKYRLKKKLRLTEEESLRGYLDQLQ